ncbi:MAG TPA: DUF3644 domain-containing protein [Dehalococcoidia bacterium]|nr:DUF3644 domain-containing protein [Dehalococcoidia bacterium]
MSTRMRRVYSIQAELLRKSKEAALNAVQTYNNPLTTFKSESFIVLMIIAWMYLLHAYYRSKGIDYRYYTVKNGRKRYDRTKSGARKYWELERCLNDDACPLDGPTKANLRFLIGLRHEIEHQICLDLDEQMAGRYLACCLNYEAVLTSLFGPEHSLEQSLPFTLQFTDLMTPVTKDAAPTRLPSEVSKYIRDFDDGLSDEEFGSQKFAVRLLFTQKTANRRGQADRVLEFIAPEDELAQAIEKQYWVIKGVEKPKRRASEIIKMMQKEGYSRFNRHSHTALWKKLDAKNPTRGYAIELGGQWFWYENWVARVREECQAHPELYGPTGSPEVA